ncbi:MAG: hypothetical protein KAT43_04805 [Nanoarchaeota archaeon]|nr:hypothetical protein [Nanoarchaeota archaeon]
MAHVSSGFRIFYKTDKYEGYKTDKHEGRLNGILVCFEQLDDIRDQRMSDWYMCHECSQIKGPRTQCRFDGMGNFVDFSIYKSMGQRYHVEAAIFVSPTVELLEDTVASFGLPFDKDIVTEDVREFWY